MIDAQGDLMVHDPAGLLEIRRGIKTVHSRKGLTHGLRVTVEVSGRGG